jgi:hypothetical protein
VWNERTGSAVVVGSGVVVAVDLRDWPTPAAMDDAAALEPQAPRSMPASAAGDEARSGSAGSGKPGGGA